MVDLFAFALATNVTCYPASDVGSERSYGSYLVKRSPFEKHGYLSYGHFSPRSVCFHVLGK